jgi:riboflavin-specific deaminase-like protein
MLHPGEALCHDVTGYGAAVRQVLPVPVDDVDPLDVYGAPSRPAPAGRPWVLVNMIESVDGATALAGRSGALGGPADKRVFAAVRSVADAVLVAAGTVRIEGYGPARPTAAVRERRAARGQAPVPTIAVVSRKLDLDPTTSLFTEAEVRTVVLTSESADADRRRALEAVADVEVCGADSVEVPAALAVLQDRGAGVVLAEGGPSLNGQLVVAGVVDELCLTVSPLLAAGESARIAHGGDPSEPLALGLAHVLEEDGLLFLRYERR